MSQVEETVSIIQGSVLSSIILVWQMLMEAVVFYRILLSIVLKLQHGIQKLSTDIFLNLYEIFGSRLLTELMSSYKSL